MSSLEQTTAMPGQGHAMLPCHMSMPVTGCCQKIEGQLLVHGLHLMFKGVLQGCTHLMIAPTSWLHPSHGCTHLLQQLGWLQQECSTAQCSVGCVR